MEKRKTITVYHGSENIVRKPVFGNGNPRNDYGLGFYCTESPDLAKEWACSEMKSGYANRYSLDMESLNALNLSDGKYCILHWLTILLRNRVFSVHSPVSIQGRQYLLDCFSIDTSPYDIITGYRADDSYFSFAQDFLSNTISVRKLSEAMHLGKLGEQIVLVSKKAFSNIRYEGSEPADRSIFYPLRKQRDELARNTYFSERGKAVFKPDDLFLIDIIREGIKPDDPRLQ